MIELLLDQVTQELVNWINSQLEQSATDEVNENKGYLKCIERNSKNSSKFPLGDILSLHKFSENILTSCLYDI